MDDDDRGRDPPPRHPPAGDPPDLPSSGTSTPAGSARSGDGPSADSARITRPLPQRPEAADEAPTLEIEPIEPSREAETRRRPEPGVGKPRRATRWLRRIAVALLALVAAAAIVLAVAFDSIARWYVLREAERRGIVIDAGEMEVSWDRASFWNASIRLEGVPAVGMHVDLLEVQALGLLPTGAKIRGVDLEASSIDAVRQALAFGRDHESDLVPFVVTDVRAALGRPGGGHAPLIEAKIAEVVFEPHEALVAKGAVLTVARPKLVVGPIDLIAEARGALLSIGLGKTLEGSPLRVEADLDSRRLSIDLPTTSAPTIAGWFGRKQMPNAAPWPGVFSIRAKLTGTWSADPRGDLVGHVDATLLGIVPPHPPELNGIATGKDTQTAFDFRIGPRDEGIALDKLAVVVGRLRLEGVGRIVPRTPSFVATANLRGSIPCQELVGTVAVSQLGLALGSTLGALVRQNIAGNVDVTVAISVDGERVASPDVRPTASIGCRLRLL